MAATPPTPVHNLSVYLSELEAKCGTPLSEGETEALQALDWWLGGVAVSCISLVGLMGNILSFAAISSIPLPRLSLFYKLLLMLAGFDCMFLFAGGLFMIQQVFKFSFAVYNVLFPKVIYPAAGFGMTGKTAVNLHESTFAIQ